MYNFIWDPKQKKNININTKRGKYILQQYINYLNGGKKQLYTPDFSKKTGKKYGWPKCEKYFVVENKAGKKKKKYLNKKTNTDYLCVDKLIKTKNNKIVYDKLDKHKWKAEKWDADSIYSVKSLFNKKYLCKNKHKCSGKINKSKLCQKCLTDKIAYYNRRYSTTNSDYLHKRRFKRFAKDFKEQKSYIEKIIKINKKKMLNKKKC